MGRDSLIGALLLLFSGWFYILTGQIRRPPFVPLGPAFYPRLLLGILALLGVCLIAADFWRARQRRGTRVPRPVESRAYPRYGLVIPTFLLFGAYALLLPILGYLATTTLFVAACQWVLGLRRIRQLPTVILVAVGTSALTYLIFDHYLRVLLPRGILF